MNVQTEVIKRWSFISGISGVARERSFDLAHVRDQDLLRNAWAAHWQTKRIHLLQNTITADGIIKFRMQQIWKVHVIEWTLDPEDCSNVNGQRRLESSCLEWVEEGEKRREEAVERPHSGAGEQRPQLVAREVRHHAKPERERKSESSSGRAAGLVWECLERGVGKRVSRTGLLTLLAVGLRLVQLQRRARSIRSNDEHALRHESYTGHRTRAEFRL